MSYVKFQPRSSKINLKLKGPFEPKPNCKQGPFAPKPLTIKYKYKK